MRLLKCTFLAAALCLFARAAQPDAGRSASTVVSQAGVTQYLVGFAHVTYGSWAAGGYWTTTFIFRNDSATAATVTLHFFTNGGQPLSVPVVGAQRAADQTITVPAGGATEIQVDPTSDTLTEGWAAVDSPIVGVKSQGIFTQHFSDGSEKEAVVSMLDQRTPGCIYPLPADPQTGYSMPFDNTTGRVSSYAFANTTNVTVTLHARFFGPNGEALGEIAQDIPAFGHTAFKTTDKLPSLADTKGTMRIEGAGIIPLGFRFNENSFTTWLER